jgi:hypothetical protein
VLNLLTAVLCVVKQQTIFELHFLGKNGKIRRNLIQESGCVINVQDWVMTPKIIENRLKEKIPQATDFKAANKTWATCTMLRIN